MRAASLGPACSSERRSAGPWARWRILCFPQQTAGSGRLRSDRHGHRFAGIVRTPLTSVIMIFEMTRDYSIIVPLMIANLISFLVSMRLQREPIYEALAHQEGVNLPAGESRDHLKRLQAGHFMQSEERAFPPDLDLPVAVERMKAARVNAWPVAQDNVLIGLAHLKKIDGAEGKGKRVREALSDPSQLPFIYPDQSLSLALEKMGEAGVDALPVVSRADVRRIQGVLTLPDILSAYGVMANQPAEL